MSDRDDAKDQEPDEPSLYGVLAEYGHPTELVAAADKVRKAGYQNWDTYTPFPVHGIDRAMGIRPTVLPWLVLVGGLTGCASGLLLQWWTNAYDYPWIVSGKPFWSLPANIPIIFEMTVLFSAITALVSMLALNGLPHPSHPLDLRRRFARSTDDKFFLLVEARDPRFDEDETRELLSKTGAAVVEDVPEDATTEDRLPNGIVYGLIILVVASLVPFALIAQARASKSDKPRIHAIADMDWQPKYKTQRQSTFFADTRSMREPIEGTVAVGQLFEDDALHRGKTSDGAWIRALPRQVPLSDATMERGQERYGIYCAPCHGLTGKGDGMVNARARAKNQGKWVPPTDLHMAHVRQQPIGQLFHSITNGIRNMPAYGRQIPVEDRWAILMYVRALQHSQNAKPGDLSEDERSRLK